MIQRETGECPHCGDEYQAVVAAATSSSHTFTPPLTVERACTSIDAAAYLHTTDE